MDKKRSAIYIRVSTLKQEMNGYGLEAQLNRCQEYCRYQKISEELIDVYVDSAESAKSINRPKFQEMLKKVKKNEYKEVIIFKLDRISRSIKDFAEILQTFNEHKTALISVNEGLDLNTTTGELIAKILVIFGEFELNQTRLRTKEAIYQMLREKKYPFGGVPPFGYDRDPKTKNLVANPKEKIIYLDIVDYFLENRSVQNLVMYLRRKYNLRLTDDALYAILKNPIYMGKVSYNDELYELDIPKLITKSKHLEILATLHTYNDFNREDYMFRNKIYCSSCGSKLQTSSSKKNKSKLYRYYHCPHCRTYINQDVLLTEFVETAFFKENINEKPEGLKRQMDKRMRQLTEIERLKSMIIEDLNNEEIDVTNAARMYSNLKKDKEKIESTLNEIELTTGDTSNYTYDNVIYVVENYMKKIIVNFKKKKIEKIV